jgi:hypothetical protein
MQNGMSVPFRTNAFPHSHIPAFTHSRMSLFLSLAPFPCPISIDTLEMADRCVVGTRCGRRIVEWRSKPPVSGEVISIISA